MTTELIKELFGLAVEKDICFEYYRLLGDLVLVVRVDGGLCIYPQDKDAPAQIQAAIDKVKEL